MSQSRPGIYPYHDVLGVNVTDPEDSLYLFSGYPVGLPVPSADHNGKFKRNAQWHAYIDNNGIRNYDWLNNASSTAYTLSTTHLTYAVGGNVTTTGANVLTRGVYIVEGGRIETDTAMLKPIGGSQSGDPLVYSTATKPGRIWLYSDGNSQIRFESVAAGVADSPGASEMTLVGVDINALGVVTSGSVAPITKPLPARKLPITIDLESTADITAVDVNADYVEADEVLINGGGSDSSLRVLPTAGKSTVAITGDGTEPALVFASTASTAISTTTTGADVGVEINHGGSGAALLVAPTGTGRGVFIQSTSTGVGLRVDTSVGSGIPIEAVPPSGVVGISSTTNTSAAFYGVATGTGVGCATLGGASASSLAMRGESTHDDAFAIQGLTTNTASTSAAGILGSGRGAGTGVYANASGTGYGLYVAADTTSPVRAAMHLVPQNADGSTPLQGDFQFNSARSGTGKFRGYTTQWESVHSSAKGHVLQWGSAASGALAAGNPSGNVSLAQISPEQTGDVLVTATGSLTWTVDLASATIDLIDVTSGVTIATQTERAIDTDVSATPPNNTRSFVIRGIRTLPSTVTRTFAVVVTATTQAVSYANTITSVNGVN